jgi:hypothetical protein
MPENAGNEVPHFRVIVHHKNMRHVSPLHRHLIFLPIVEWIATVEVRREVPRDTALRLPKATGEIVRSAAAHGFFTHERQQVVASSVVCCCSGWAC